MLLSLSLPSSLSLSLWMVFSSHPPTSSPHLPFPGLFLLLYAYRSLSFFCSQPSLSLSLQQSICIQISRLDVGKIRAVISYTLVLNTAEVNCPRCAIPAYVEVNGVLLVQHPVVCDINLDASAEVTFVVVNNNNI